MQRALGEDVGAWGLFLGVDGDAADTGGGEWCSRLVDGKTRVYVCGACAFSLSLCVITL